MSSERSVSVEKLSERWEEVAPNPDLENDLGYTLSDWESVSANSASGEQFLFLPSDDDLLREEAFVVADPSSVCDVIDHV
jgi:hypothetical protein